MLARLIFRNWYNRNNGQKRNYFHNRTPGHSEGREVRQALLEGQAKAAALLTHISLMIALTGILWTIEEEHSFLQIVFGWEMFVYILLALICVYCLFCDPEPLLQRKVTLNERNQKVKADAGDDERKRMHHESAACDRDIEVELMDRAFVADRLLGICRRMLLIVTAVLAITVLFSVSDVDPSQLFSWFLRSTKSLS